MNQKLTKKQNTVFNYIKEYTQEKGFSPTLKEIQNKIEVNSIRGVTQVLEALEVKNLLCRTSDKKRNIKLIDNQESDLINVAVVGSAGCDNVNVFAQPTYDEYITVDRDLIGNKQVIAVKAEGNSMQEAQIENGDYVLVEQIEKPDNNEIVLAIVNGMAVIKRFNFSKNAVVLNPEPISDIYKPIIMKEGNLKICGKVIDIIKNPVNNEPQYIDITE